MRKMIKFKIKDIFYGKWHYEEIFCKDDDFSTSIENLFAPSESNGNVKSGYVCQFT